MACDAIPLCKCGCGRPVRKRGRCGPAPEYASGACRVRACRKRKVVASVLEEVEGRPAPTAAPPLKPVPSDEQVARALLEARGLAGTFLRMGREARPQFAWRSEGLGKAIASAIDEYFGEVF